MNDRLEVKAVECDSTNDDRPLTIELMGMLKKSLKRSNTLNVILIIIIFLSNLMWIIAWNLPSDEVTDTTSSSYEYDADSKDGGNAVINDEGEVNINGEGEKESNCN